MNKVFLKFIGLVFLFFILVSCSKDYIKDKGFMSSLPKELLESKKYILVIPSNGCPGCRNQFLDFMKENIKREDIGFVLTTQKSLRDVRLMLLSREINV